MTTFSRNGDTGSPPAQFALDTLHICPFVPRTERLIT